MNELIDNILTEWSYRVNDGMPDPKNQYHLVQLQESMKSLKINDDVIDIIMNHLYEAKGHKYIKRTGSPGDYEYTYPGDGSSKTSSKEEPKTQSPASDAIHNERFGIKAKADKALKKEYITEEDAKKVDQFITDMDKFLENPSKEEAERIVEEYKLSQNGSGSKLYMGFLAGNNRKLLGEGNALVKEISAALDEHVDLKAKGNVQKRAMDILQGASKPDLKTKASAYNKKGEVVDQGVANLFNRIPYSRLNSQFHQIFGPQVDGKTIRPSSKYSKEYFIQSVKENESLDKTISALVELEEKGQASPGVGVALKKHKATMEQIAKDWDKMTTEERETAVEKSYSNMAREMHEADPDVARGIMKNMAEMALYDTELAAGQEVYLPSHGSYPSGDKLRVDRDGNGVVEKVAAVSVKFGKSGGFYGFPGETAQYVKYHPDEEKREMMRNRVGHRGYSLGIKDDFIQDKNKFNKLIKESGLSGAIKNPEAIRQTLARIQKKIDLEREKLLNDKGKYTNKDLVGIRKKLEALNIEAVQTLQQNVDADKLVDIMGESNAKAFMLGGANAINMIGFAAALNTSDGLSSIEHNHQLIDENGLESETTPGSPNLKEWKFQFRGFDNRGGGLLAGFVGETE